MMEQDGRSLLDIVNEELSSGDVRLPVFNQTALRVHQETMKEEPDFKRIEEIIVTDQSLTGQVLREANSAFYRGLQKVSTIHEAIIRLGLNAVSNIVLVVTQRKQFVSKDPFLNEIMEILWRHSQETANAAQWIAQHCQFESIKTEAFFAGLLHDVGKLFILTVIDSIRQKIEHIDPTQALINEVMESMHAREGYNLMKNWNLPERYCEVARDHHLEEFDHNNFLLAIVSMANKTCNKLGVGLKPDASIVLAATPEANILGLSEIDLARLEVAVEDSLEKYRGVKGD